MFATFALLVGLLTLLAVPLDIAFAVHRGAGFDGSVSLRWLFGLVWVRLPANRPRKEDKPRKPSRRKKRPAKPHLIQHSLAILTRAALRKRISQFVASVLRSFRVRDLALRLRLGMDDPADTGMLCGLAGPAIALLKARPSARVNLEPNFLEASFEADAQGTVRLIPLQIAYLTLAFVFSPIVLWAVWQLMAGRPPVSEGSRRNYTLA